VAEIVLATWFFAGKTGKKKGAGPWHVRLGRATRQLWISWRNHGDLESLERSFGDVGSLPHGYSNTLIYGNIHASLTMTNDA